MNITRNEIAFLIFWIYSIYVVIMMIRNVRKDVKLSLFERINPLTYLFAPSYLNKKGKMYLYSLYFFMVVFTILVIFFDPFRFFGKRLSLKN